MNEQEPNGEGVQDSYLPPDVPPGYVLPPSGTQFANATWLRAGSEIRGYVDEMIGQWDEFRDLRDLDYSVVWRRNGKPMRGDEPIFATVDITPPRYVWEALQLEERNFPRFVVDLRWTHFDDMRRGKAPGEPDDGEETAAPRAAEYVHRDVLKQHVHHALMSLYVENDIVHRRAPDYTGYVDTVKRFGAWTSGISAVRTQLSLFDQQSPAAQRGRRAPHIQAAD